MILQFFPGKVIYLELRGILTFTAPGGANRFLFFIITCETDGKLELFVAMSSARINGEISIFYL